MANIQHWLDQIRRAIYGREVRSSIADSIEAINKETESTTTKQENLEGTFNQLIINAGNSNAEIVQARVKADGTQFNTLSERLAKSDEQFEELNKEVVEARTDKAGVDHGRLKVRLDNIDEQLDKIVSLSNNSNVDLMRTKRIAHRGYNVLAPENSIPAYELAAEYGFWGGECDVTETLDNEFVLMHDDTIDRTTNGTGKVSSYTLEQLKNFNIDVGNNISLYPNLKIPTLDEFLLTCKKIDLVPVIEIKSISDSNIDKFLDKIRSYGFINKAIIISFNYDLLVKIRNKENRVMLQPLLDLTQENINKCVALGVNTHIDCPYSQVTKENIELAHKKGLLVNAWTVNGENKLNELIDYGIDFITTDKLFDEETVKYKLKNNLSISANQISSIQLGESRNKVGLTYEEIIIKSSLSNRCSTVNRFYRALNDTVVINMPTEYKLTLMPFDATGAYLRDYGWFTNGEIDISHHTDVDHYHIYFARVDDANFTENDISILKQKVSVFFKTKANTITANQISSIQLGESRNKVGLTYEEIIIKSSLSNRCSTVNRFYRALNDTVVINMPTEYKLTLMPFDATGAYLRDYGWFTNGEIDISHHTDVDHYHIYFARVDDANFTENDISILKQKVSVFFKTKANTTSNRKYVFLINGAPMALQGVYSADKCTVVYDGDSTKTFTLTHDIPLSTPYPGVAFGNISLTGDLDVDIRVRGESKTGFKFAFIKKSTNTLLTEAEINKKSWFYFNLVHMG